METPQQTIGRRPIRQIVSPRQQISPIIRAGHGGSIPMSAPLSPTGFHVVPLPARAQHRPLLQPTIPQSSTLRSTPVTIPLSGCPPQPSNIEKVDDNPTDTQPTVARRNNPRKVSYALTDTENLPELIIQENVISIYNDDDLRRDAVVRVEKSDLMGPKTVNDPAMGVIDKGVNCATCYYDYENCTGHFGFIELNAPIYHPRLIRDIIRILNIVCNSCGGLLMTKEQIEKQGFLKYRSYERLKVLETATEKLTCPYSQEGPLKCLKNPIYLPGRLKETKGVIMYKRGKNEPEMERRIEEVDKIFQGISLEDAKLMGFDMGHPKHLIRHTWPVPPPCTRPSYVINGTLNINPMTIALQEIVKINNSIKLETREKEKQDLIDLLSFKINGLISAPETKNTFSKRPKLITYMDQLKGKEGIFRSMMSGTRTDFSGRTPLGPNPSLRFGQIAIPLAMADKLTVPERAFQINLNELQKRLERGEIVSVAQGKKVVNINEKNRKHFKLQIGHIANRKLRNGDYLIFNRQPTLHRYGMMGYEVVLWENLTIGLYPGVNTPHGADYDGDEGNLHMVQTLGAASEVRELMSVKHCIMNTQNSQPLISIFFDNLTAVTMLTSVLVVKDKVQIERNGEKVEEIIERKIDVVIDQDLFTNCLLLMTNQSALPTLQKRLSDKGVPEYSGRALFSAFLPEDFYYIKGEVSIINGILIHGTITKDHVGSVHGSIIQVLWQDYGEERTVDFLSDVPAVLNLWWSQYSLTVSLKDCFPKDENFRQEIDKEYAKARLSIQGYMTNSDFLNDPLAEAKKEEHIMGYLNKAKDTAYNIVKQNLSPNNAFSIMVLSGSKGSWGNIGQIIGMGGLQDVLGRMLPSTQTKRLPYFSPQDLDPRAWGMVVNSLVSGMTPPEYFSHMTKSREGVMNTAGKTADTGDMHNKIVKAIGEDVIVHHDTSVRNRTNKIYQESYGNDGFDPTYLEFVTIGGVSKLSFINIRRLADRINASYNYTYTNPPQENTNFVSEAENNTLIDFLFEEEDDGMYQGEYDFNES